MRVPMRVWAAALMGVACGAAAAGAAPLPRVVSLDYCADQYVLALADREQILAVSPAAGAEYSYMAERAQGVPRARPTPEDEVARSTGVLDVSRTPTLAREVRARSRSVSTLSRCNSR